ncbi:hypothetical protein [Sphingobium indicum]|uniref:hypothetical protein n=1 Tax=Sphingobium indicum TaxID=332055 RepID=UPI0011E00D30|nr:hypothetical protein [Sphingobium indicum]
MAVHTNSLFLETIREEQEQHHHGGERPIGDAEPSGTTYNRSNKSPTVATILPANKPRDLRTAVNMSIALQPSRDADLGLPFPPPFGQNDTYSHI